VTVCAQGRIVDPGIRDGINDIVFASSEQIGNHSGRGNFKKEHMIQSDTIEAVFQGKNP